MRMRHGWPYVLALVFTMVSVRTFGGGRIYAPDPEPSVGSTELTGAVVATNTPATPAAAVIAPPPSPLTPAPSVVVDCFNIDTNAVLNAGSLYIPPDPHGAVGPDYVIVIGNCIIEWRPKVGITSTAEYQSSLKNFFSALPGSPPGPAAGSTLSTRTFDPKVIYDQYAGRFVVVVLERWMTVLGNASDQSRILLAISKTSNPNDGWWLHAIDSKLNISALDRWVDYPGIGCDDKAVYVTGNMYSFAASPAYGGSRVWVIKKTPTYAGPNNNVAYAVYDPFVGGVAVATTAQPAQMFGTLPNGSTGRPLGTFLVSYSGLSDGTNEYLQIVELTDPLAAAGGPYFTLQQINLGDIENASVALPGAPQLGSGVVIATNDRRAQNAVWRNNNLYTCATYRAPAAPNLNQSTARWWRLNTTTPMPGLTVADAGNAGGEDIGAGAYTFFPSVMVDSDGNMGMNFALSGPTVYPGAYYATRMAGDPAGTLGATCTLHAGTDWYYRVFTGTVNRWGDFSSLALCPLDEGDFWAFNEYAMTRGTITNGTQDGRWQLVVGKFRLKPLVSVAITSFDAMAKDGAVLLRATFRSNLGVESVSVYRADGATGDMRAIATEFAAGERFEYTDRTAHPGAHYRYQIGVRDADGEFLSPVAEISVPPLEAALGQNSPNPFNPSTIISFTLPVKERVTIVVYDANGKQVRTLVDEDRDFGTHEVAWDGRDDAGAVVGSGVYFYRLTAGKHSESKKMVLLK
jgi:FlgD Ig-like domain